MREQDPRPRATGFRFGEHDAARSYPLILNVHRISFPPFVPPRLGFPYRLIAAHTPAVRSNSFSRSMLPRRLFSPSRRKRHGDSNEVGTVDRFPARRHSRPFLRTLALFFDPLSGPRFLFFSLWSFLSISFVSPCRVASCTYTQRVGTRQRDAN